MVVSALFKHEACCDQSSDTYFVSIEPARIFECPIYMVSNCLPKPSTGMHAGPNWMARVRCMYVQECILRTTPDDDVSAWWWLQE